jgi:hypothetical protein
MITIAIAVPVIIALVSAIKGVGLDSKYAPIVSILLGISFMAGGGEGTIFMKIFEGIIAGLSASGLYSGAKATLA